MKINFDIKSKLRIVLFVFLPFLVLSTGCATFNNGTNVSPSDDSRSVVFGQFDLNGERIDWVTFRELGPRSKIYHVPVYSGVFFHIGVPETSVQVNSFGRNHDKVLYRYDFSSAGRDLTTKDISEPGVYFMGSYKILESDSEFDVAKTRKPSEKEVLEKVLKVMLADEKLRQYEHQIGRIKERLRQL